MTSHDNRDLRSLLVGVLIGCGVTILVWPEARESGDRGDAPLQTEQMAMNHDSAHGRRYGDLEDSLPQARVAIESTKPEEEAIEEDGIDLAGFVDVLPMKIPTPAELERRYGEMPLVELVGAEKMLNHVVHTEAVSFLEKKMERGLFTTHVIANGAPMEQSGIFPDGSPRSTMMKSRPIGDGLQEVLVAEIHPKEQPILEARHAEIAWVSQRVQDMTRELKR